MAIIDELVAVLGYDLQGEGDLKRFNQGLDHAERNAKGVANRINAMTVAVGTFVGTLASQAVMRFGSAIGALPGNIINVNAEFEGYLATLETIDGSAEKAKKSFDWITRFAVKTPFEIDELTRAFVRLKAYGIDPTDGTMATLGDTASAMGTSLMQAVEMFADASTMEFERIKEYGLKASQKGDEVTFRWTKNGKELTKTMKKNSEEVRKFLLDNFGSRFNGAMIRQSKTWSGMLSNLGDAWTMFQYRVGDKGFFNSVKERLAAFLDYIGRLDANGTLDKWAQTLSDGFTSATDGIATVVGNLVDHFKFLTQWINVNPDLWEKIKTGLLAVAAVVFPRTAALLVLDEVLSALEGKDSYIRDIANAISEFLGVDVETATNWLSGFAVAGAGLAVAVGPINLLAAGLKALAGSLVLLGNAGAAKGLAVLGRFGLIAGGVAVTAGVVAEYGPDVPIRDPAPNTPAYWLNKLSGGRLLDGGHGRGGNRTTPKTDRLNLGQSEPDPTRFQQGIPSVNGVEELRRALANMNANASKLGGAAGAVVNDNRVSNDNRQFPMNTSVTVNQTVTGATSAPGAAARATGSAVANAVTGQKSRIASMPTTSGNGPQ